MPVRSEAAPTWSRAADRADGNFDGLISSHSGPVGGGWQNCITGLGTFERDKVLQGRFTEPWRVSDPELASMFNGNDLCRRIVSGPPMEMLRLGYKLVFPSAQGDQHENANLAEEVQRGELDAREVTPLLLDSMIFTALFGGGGIVVMAQDGRDPSEPLDLENVQTIEGLYFVDRRWLFAHTWYEKLGAKYGQVETYQVTNSFGGQVTTIVHESRMIRLEGAPVDILKRRMLQGWTLSELQAPYDVLRQFDSSFQALSNILTDMAQATMKINGLMHMISNDPDTLNTRMKLTDMMRSSGRMILLDAENEEFERKASPISGMPESLELMMMRVAGAAGTSIGRAIPQTLLFGRSPQGMNATGDSDFRMFYDGINWRRKNYLEPKLIRLVRILCAAKDSVTRGKIPDRIEIEWPKLWVPSEKEQSEIYLNTSKADTGSLGYVGAQVLLPAEVALARFRGGTLNVETNIDMEAHRKLEAKQDATRQGAPGGLPPAPGTPPPEPAGPPGAKKPAADR